MLRFVQMLPPCTTLRSRTIKATSSKINIQNSKEVSAFVNMSYTCTRRYCCFSACKVQHIYNKPSQTFQRSQNYNTTTTDYKKSSAQRQLRLPALSILSWSVDAGNLRSHSSCRRRLSLPERIPHIIHTIISAKPDIVALQRSSAEVATALCQCNSISTKTTELENHNKSESYEENNRLNKQDENKVQYQLIASARNGNSGEVQLFVKTHSQWDAHMLLSGFGVNVELQLKNVKTQKEHERNSQNTSSLAAKNSYEHLPRCVISNIDLGFRGKSVGFHGVPLTSSLVSREGGALTLRASGVHEETNKWNINGNTNKKNFDASSGTEENQESSMLELLSERNGDEEVNNVTTVVARPSNKKLKAQRGDVHRHVALEHLLRTTEPDIVLGNFHLPNTDGLDLVSSDYTDAWRKSGAPAKYELTTNTHRRSAANKYTNYFYFVTSPFVKPRSQLMKEVQNAPTHLLHTIQSCNYPVANLFTNETNKETTIHKKNSVNSNEVNQLVGQTVPLHAISTADGNWVYKETEESAHAGITTSKESNSNNDINKALATEQEKISTKEEEELSLEDKEEISHDDWIDHYRRYPLYKYTMGTPEVASRFQRCYLREHSVSSPLHSQSDARYKSNASSLFANCYKRCRVIVLQPFVKVHIGPKEAEWLHVWRTMHQQNKRNIVNVNSNTSDEGNSKSLEQQKKEEKCKTTSTYTGFDTRCSVSDEYPLLILLS